MFVLDFETLKIPEKFLLWDNLGAGHILSAVAVGRSGVSRGIAPGSVESVEWPPVATGSDTRRYLGRRRLRLCVALFSAEFINLGVRVSQPLVNIFFKTENYLVPGYV